MLSWEILGSLFRLWLVLGPFWYNVSSFGTNLGHDFSYCRSGRVVDSGSRVVSMVFNAMITAIATVSRLVVGLIDRHFQTPFQKELIRQGRLGRNVDSPKISWSSIIFNMSRTLPQSLGSKLLLVFSVAFTKRFVVSSFRSL